MTHQWKDQTANYSGRMDDDRPTKQNNKLKKSDLKRLRIWFGDESSEDDDTSEDSTDNKVWDVIQRKQKSKEKKRKRKIGRNVSKNQPYTGPCNNLQENIETHRGMDIDYEAAKKLAVENFLANYLKFDDSKWRQASLWQLPYQPKVMGHICSV